MSKVTTILKKHLHEFTALGKNYSWRYASYNFIWWVCFYVRTRLSWRISKWALHKKTDWLDKFVENDVKEYLNNIKQHDNQHNVQQSDMTTIWVFWGQGHEAMPPLVKSCYNQLTSHNDNVTLITNDNVREYIDIPELVITKVNDGRLTWAFFSDIVRTSLLARYGGLWLDATVWVSGKLPMEQIKTMSMWSANGKTSHSSHDICFWTSERWSWSGWCLFARQKDYPLFDFVSKMLIKRATTDTMLVDYVLVDYFIHYACRLFIDVQQDMETMSIVNMKRNSLAAIMNTRYDKSTYEALTATDFVFKLSYKAKWKSESAGSPTFYGTLLKGEL